MNVFDAIVVGLGGHGSATVAQLAARGKRVLGIEQFTQNHKNGSSHGMSRVIRQIYYEHPKYVPLLTRSIELWRQLMNYQAMNMLNELPLLNMVGGLFIGLPDSHIIEGMTKCANELRLPLAVLTAEEIRKKYQVFKVTEEYVGLYDENAGYLIPDLCIKTYIHQAKACDDPAEIHYGEKFLSWSEETLGDENLIRIVTDKGEYLCRKLVLSVGPWAPQIYGDDVSLPLHVERRVLYWQKPVSGVDTFKDVPIYMWDIGQGDNFYGFPYQDTFPKDGVKVAMHLLGDTSNSICSPETIDRAVHREEIEAMKRVLCDRIPEIAGETVHVETCMYTVTPDEHFLIDFHPKNSNVILASPCSGHGFKFCSVIGEILSDLCVDSNTRHDIEMFRVFPGRKGLKSDE